MAEDKPSGPPGSRGRLARLIGFARSHGKIRALYRLLRRLAESRPLRRWCRFCAVEVFRASICELQSKRRTARSFVIRPAEEEDTPAVDAFYSGSREIHERIRRGDICMLALVKDQIGAAVWLSLGPNDYPEDWEDLRCIVRYPPGVCWTYDGVGTRLGAWGSLMARLPELLQQRGVTDVFTQIECDNRASLDSHKSLGYRSVGFVWCLGVFGLVLRLYKVHGARWRLLPGRMGELEVG